MRKHCWIMTIQKLVSSWIIPFRWKWGLAGAFWRVKALFRRALVTQIQASFAPDGSVMSEGYNTYLCLVVDGMACQRENPLTFPLNSVCANYNLVSSCQFVIAASYMFLSTLALSWSLLLLHVVRKIYTSACNKSMWLNRETLEVYLWRCRKTGWLV